VPVLLTREEEFQTWIMGTPEEAFALAQEYPADRIAIVQEGYEKEDLLAGPSVERRIGTLL
jgi:hypothetical protein